MEDLYRQNRIYKTIELFVVLRKTTISAMCKKASISAGLVTDLKMGRKQDIYKETASKIANALDISMSLFDSNEICISSEWDVDEYLKWNDADTDADRLFLLNEYGFPSSMKKNDKFIDLALNAILSCEHEEKEKSPIKEDGGLNSYKYSLLNETNKATIDALIEHLLKSQSGE